MLDSALVNFKLSPGKSRKQDLQDAKLCVVPLKKHAEDQNQSKSKSESTKKQDLSPIPECRGSWDSTTSLQ